MNRATPEPERDLPSQLGDVATVTDAGALHRLDVAWELWHDCFSDPVLMWELATKLTCGEAETFANFMAAFGGDDYAARFLDAHAETDEHGDLHYRGESHN